MKPLLSLERILQRDWKSAPLQSYFGGIQ